ncbi:MULTISPECIES: acyltransferase family protein [Lacticaseibacillus]|uniref:Acyltransferase n=1 Tax=Lacticaseibacillus casei DSM 20011 = JCM 1134 = ATCC 393 TaxID=1423732 RepID=A0AAD1ETS6_LACCA|nr:acyltransferase [Lacticaseibacillus casei]HAJ54737.1 acyltransferase [Lactobacillus sp.]MBI6597473.1 acyltransferase [Lacticaseibacillus casei]MBO1481155.1 acyltransferase [Lacticaseibacillus casei]MBO2416449.1 acyltransferase [Lacticaseibacillus casei]MCK2080836.1 acyltransferase [Lacticaseibacillus casei]
MKEPVLTATAAKPAKKHRYLYEIDLMRLIFIAGVLLNHTTTAFEHQLSSGFASTALLATHLMIHFTRMGFMFMTGLVLTMVYYSRKRNWPLFFKKRFTTVGIPYVLWNTLLMIGSILLGIGGFTIANFWPDYLSAILHGDQFYLYYVLVTLQLYLLFPAMLWLFKKTEGHHGALALASFGLQLLIVAGIKYGLPHIDTSGWLWWFRAYGVNVFTYQFFFIAGGLFSLHAKAVKDWLLDHQLLIGISTLILSFGTIGLYVFNKQILGMTHSAAVSPHQPYMLVYDVVMIAFVALLGQKYATWHAKQPTHWFACLVGNGAQVSFGVYLCQTIALSLLSGVLGLMHLSNLTLLLLLPLGYLGILGVSFGIAWFCYKVSPFGWLIGRPQSLSLSAKGVLHHEQAHRSVISESHQSS